MQRGDDSTSQRSPISYQGERKPGADQFRIDHPDPNKNVFIMMRFQVTHRLTDVNNAIKSTLLEKKYHAIRADDRYYMEELWSNVKLCMHESRLGIAVFEDIDRDQHDANIAVELGYMLALGRRCLILRERRLPDLPVVLAQHLYRSFDMFDVLNSVRAAVSEWIDIDVEGRLR